jgi:ribosomal protein S18 acetylase RimI-like enzyme
MGSRVTPLPWDTEFFGVSIASAEIAEDTVAGALEEAEARGVQCLYLVIPGAHPPSLAAAVRRGGRLVDLRVTLDLETRIAPPSGVRLADGGDLAALMPLARGLSRSSRFGRDPRFPDEVVVRMYETWLERCLSEGSVVVPDGKVVGFVGVQRGRSDTVSVDLVYVDSSARGEGLAARLVRGALAGAGSGRARVATQVWNVGAQRLYQEIGFRTSSVEAILHVWLDDGPHSSVETPLASRPPS